MKKGLVILLILITNSIYAQVSKQVATFYLNTLYELDGCKEQVKNLQEQLYISKEINNKQESYIKKQQLDSLTQANIIAKKDTIIQNTDQIVKHEKKKTAKAKVVNIALAVVIVLLII